MLMGLTLFLVRSLCIFERDRKVDLLYNNPVLCSLIKFHKSENPSPEKINPFCLQNPDTSLWVLLSNITKLRIKFLTPELSGAQGYQTTKELHLNTKVYT